MKNKFFLLSLLFFLLESSWAQQKEVRKISVAAGHGIGNVWTHFLKDAYNVPEYKVSSFGPVTLVGEYVLNKKISIGLSFTYSKLKGDFNKNGFAFSDQLTIFTALARANYHFFDIPQWDLYAGVGIGYVYSKYKSSVGSSSSNVPGQFGYSAQVGLRYALSNTAGIFSEIGYVNGSFLQLGASVRF